MKNTKIDTNCTIIPHYICVCLFIFLRIRPWLDSAVKIQLQSIYKLYKIKWRLHCRSLLVV